MADAITGEPTGESGPGELPGRGDRPGGFPATRELEEGLAAWLARQGGPRAGVEGLSGEGPIRWDLSTMDGAPVTFQWLHLAYLREIRDLMALAVFGEPVSDEPEEDREVVAIERGRLVRKRETFHPEPGSGSIDERTAGGPIEGVPDPSTLDGATHPRTPTDRVPSSETPPVPRPSARSMGVVRIEIPPRVKAIEISVSLIASGSLQVRYLWDDDAVSAWGIIS